MKQIIQKFSNLLLASLLLVSIAHAQAPNLFNYQAVARNASGAVLVNQAIGLQFTIVNGTETGPTQYQETQTATTNGLGLFTVQIGAGTVVSGTVAGVSWSSGENFLKVQIDPTGGTNYTVTGTSQLLSVPYALYAANGGGSGSSLTGSNSYGAGGGPLAMWTGATSLGSTSLQVNAQDQYWFNGQTGPIGNSTLSIENGTVSGAPTDALFAVHVINTGGTGIYAQNNGGPATEVLENDGQGLALSIIANNSQYAMQLTDYSAGVAGNAFAGFGNGGNTDLVTINETSNGHGQISFASDTNGTAIANLNANTGGLNVQVINANGTATITQTGIAASGAEYICPYSDQGAYCGLSGSRWIAVYSTNGTIQTSDSRYKENVQPVQYGLNTIMQLNPVSYTWKNKKLQLGTGVNLGFIAQDVEKVLPDVIVHTINTDAEIAEAKKDRGQDMEKESYGVKYAEFTPVIVKAIQEQQKMINDLKTIVLQQQQQIEELKNK